MVLVCWIDLGISGNPKVADVLFSSDVRQLATLEEGLAVDSPGPSP